MTLALSMSHGSASRFDPPPPYNVTERTSVRFYYRMFDTTGKSRFDLLGRADDFTSWESCRCAFPSDYEKRKVGDFRRWFPKNRSYKLWQVIIVYNGEQVPDNCDLVAFCSQLSMENYAHVIVELSLPRLMVSPFRNRSRYLSKLLASSKGSFQTVIDHEISDDNTRQRDTSHSFERPTGRETSVFVPFRPCRMERSTTHEMHQHTTVLDTAPNNKMELLQSLLQHGQEAADYAKMASRHADLATRYTVSLSHVADRTWSAEDVSSCSNIAIDEDRGAVLA